MKMICTSPLSSMALTAMLGLTGLPMGIACIACVGGAFTNGMIFNTRSQFMDLISLVEELQVLERPYLELYVMRREQHHRFRD